MRGRALCALVIGAVLANPAVAQWAGWDYDFDQEIKSWKEIQAQIPAFPRQDTLIPLEIGGAFPHRVYIDETSVSRGEDGVMRYTTVIRTAGGATNITFEGMRCETRERKIYALGRNDGTWVRARDPKWNHITFRETAPHHGMLFTDYFCPSRYTLPSAKEAVAALKSRRSLNPARGGES